MFSEAELLKHLASELELSSVILYGSVTRGALSPESDVDVVCFVDGPQRYPKAYVWNGLLLDTWIHPVVDARVTNDFLKLNGGRLLLDTHGIGQDLLHRVSTYLAQPRPALDELQAEHLRVWVWKMWDRATSEDVRGYHRLHWLLHELPEIWCDLTGRHFLGPNDTFTRMAANCSNNLAARQNPAPPTRI